MPKKNKTIEEIYKENDENIENLVQQLKEAGVTEKTIKKVLDEIHLYQQKLLEEQLREMHKRMIAVLTNAIKGDE